MYGVTGYVLAKIFIEFIIVGAQTAYIIAWPYFFWGMNGPFTMLWIVNWIIGLSGSATGMMLACVNANAPERTLMMTPVVLSTLPNVFSGAFRPIGEMPWFISWASYIVPTTYGLRLFGFFENAGLEYRMTLETRRYKKDWVTGEVDYSIDKNENMALFPDRSLQEM